MKKLLAIEWLDHASYSTNGWHSPQEVQELKPCRVVSVGWIAHETDTHIILVATKCMDAENDSVNGEVCILKNVITKRIRLVDPFK